MQTADTVCRGCGTLLPYAVVEAADYLYGCYREDVLGLEDCIAERLNWSHAADDEIATGAILDWIGHQGADLVAAVRHHVAKHRS